MASNSGEMSLLLTGLSLRTSVDLESIKEAICTIDAQLAENTASLQESWGKFLSDCNAISLGQDSSARLDSREAVSLLSNPDVIQGKCCPSEPIMLNCFLNNVNQALERNPGQEEAIFQDLVQFAQEQGILLPPALPGKTNEDMQSAAPINAIFSKDTHGTSQLWEIIRYKLHRALWLTMGKIPLTSEPESRLISHRKRLNVLQNLCFLFPAGEILDSYKQYRLQQVQRCITDAELLCNIKVEFSGGEENTPKDVMGLAKVGKALEVMILEDSAVLDEEIFSEKFLTFEYVHGTYLKKFTEELKGVLENHTSEEGHGLGSTGSSKSGDLGVSDHVYTLQVFRHCYLSALSLELMVQMVKEQQERNKIGFRLGHILHSPPSPTTNRRSPTRLTSRGSDLNPLFSTEESLPPPFGPKQDHFKEAALCSASKHLESSWLWRDEFKNYTSRLSMAVSSSIKQCYESALAEEDRVYSNTKEIPLVRLKDHLIGGKQDYPRCLSKSCASFMSKAEDALALASSQGGKIFQVVRSSFVDSVETCLKSYLSRSTQVLSDFPKSCSLDYLYTVFSNALFIRNQLVYFEEVMGSEPRRPFPFLLRQYGEFVDQVSDQVVCYHNNLIASVILQDAQSHDWTDMRAFYEDERCSFSVQMWNYYMQCLRRDLWRFLSPEKAQHIFTAVLQDSLSIFVARYSSATPSANRVKQFRSDVTAILLCVMSFLWSASTCVSMLLNPQCSSSPLVTIHNLSSCLLATMTVVTSPLQLLCSRVLREEGSDKEPGSRTAWLSWFHPEVFRSHEGSLSALPDRQAMYVLYKLMINQPVPNWPLVLQALLSRNARLPVTIVKYGDLSRLGKTALSVRDSSDSSWFEADSVCETEGQQFSEGLVSSLYEILFQCSQETSGLVNFLIALVSREDSWKMFESSSALKIPKKEESPLWLNCIYKTFDPYIRRFLYPSLNRFCQQNKKVAKSYNFTSMSSLPCGCPCKKPKPASAKNKTEVLYAALQDLLAQLTDNISAVPKAICQFLNKLQESLHQKSIDLSNQSGGIKVLASLLYRWLMDVDRVSSVCVRELSVSNQSSVRVFADVVWHVLVGQSSGDPNLPSEIDALLMSKRRWLNEKVAKIKAHIAEQVYEEYQVETVDAEMAHLQISRAVTALMKEKTGETSLRHVYKFLQANKEWLMNLVLVTGYMLPPGPANTAQAGQQSSNPLRFFSMIGEWAFNQDKIASFPFDWEALLQSNLAIPPETVRRLVLNRYEMQTSAQLNDEESAQVALMKEHYGLIN